MYKFIYVFDKETSDAMVEQGLTLIKSDDDKKVYVFENKPEMTFNFSKKDFVYSNTLTF